MTQPTTAKVLQNNITYLTEIPIIDGKRDPFLNHLPKRQFDHFYNFDNIGTKNVVVTYSLAYHQDGLYILFETNAQELSYHKRGYLYGDGYKVTLGFYKSSGRSDEYYELVYSPTLQSEDRKWRQYIASFNFDGIPRTLSQKSLSQETVTSHGTSFEAFIAWDDIYPYHPQLHSDLGINLYFAKGLIDQNNQYVTNGFAINNDEAIWDEEIIYRKLSKLIFEKPKKTSSSNSLVLHFLQRSIVKGSPLNIRVITPNKPYHWNISNPTNRSIISGYFDQNSDYIATIATENLVHGEYSLEVTSHDQTNKKSFTFTIFPPLDYEPMIQQLNSLKEHDRGIVNTLIYKITSLYNTIDNTKAYESGENVLQQIVSIQQDWEAIQKGQDPYQTIDKPLLRAFHSELDGTLQSYTIRLPEGYHSKKQYPLLVFLHGSGQDHTQLLNKKRANGEYIEVAPFGRDKFKAYAYQQSQIDIEEVISDVKKHFSIQQDKIVIGGFSMGGYGALLTYYRNPKLFKAVAVFSGHPNLANEWIDDIKSPNFLDTLNLSIFNDVPIFIYHGTHDPALSFALIKDLSHKMQQSGAKVTTSFIEGRGHVYQDEKTQKLYDEWLKHL